MGGSGGGAGGDGEVASGARRVDLHRLHVGHVGFCQLWLLGGGRRGMAVLFGAHLRALAPTRRRFGRGGSSPLVFLHSVGEALCRAKRGPWGRGQWGDGHRGGNDPMCGQVSRSGCVDSQQREKDVLSTCARRTEAGRKVETADRSSIVPRRWTPSAVIGMREACSRAGGADATTWRCRRGGLGFE